MNVDQWLLQNRMIANVKKRKSLLTGSKSAIKKAGNLEVRLSDETVEQVDSFDYLAWESHITRLCRRTHSRLSLLNRISAFLPNLFYVGSTNKQFYQT